MFGRLNPKIPNGNSDLSKEKMLALGKLSAKKNKDIDTGIYISFQRLGTSEIILTFLFSGFSEL